MLALAGLGFALGVGGLATPSLAQDAGASERKSPGDARAEAVKTVPAWAPYGADDDATMEETFFRLAQDFVSTSEIGVRRLGHVPIWPRGDLKLGRVRIMPYLRESGEWESNQSRSN